MAESAERDVIFRMHAQPDKSALPNAKKFGQSLEKIQTKAIDNVDKRRMASMDVLTRLSKASVDLERKAHKEVSAMINARIALRKKELGLEGRSGTRSSPGTGKRVSAGRAGGADDITKRLREEQKAREKASKEFEKNLAREQKAADKASKEAGKRFQKEINDRIKLRDREAKEAERLRKQQEREEDRMHSRHRKRQQAIAADNRRRREKETQEAVRAAQQQAKQEDRIRQQQEKEEARIHKRHRQRQKSIALQNRKNRQQEAREAQRALQATEQQMAQATGRMSAANGLLVEGVTSAGESAVRLATGLATVGLVGEKNNEKLLRGLVLLRGMNDVVAGGINLWNRSRKIIEGYSATLSAIKTTQQAIAAQQALGPGVGRGAARRVGGNVAGSVAGGAAGGLAGKAALTGLQRASLAVGSVLGTIKTAATAAAAPLAKVGAVLGSLAFYGDVIGSLVTTGSPASRPGSRREGIEKAGGSSLFKATSFVSRRLPDSFLDASVETGGGTVSHAERGRRRVDRMKSERAQRLDREEQQRTLDEKNRKRVKDQATRRLGDAELRGDVRLQPFMSAVDTTRGDDRLQAIDSAKRAISKQQATMQSVDTGGSTEARGEQLEKLIALDDKMVELAEQRKQTETKILQSKKEQATVAIDSSRKELENAKETLATTQDRIKTIKDSLLSAEVRFGQKSEQDQKKFLAVSRKANAGQKLNRQERELLLSEGIGRAKEVAQQQAIETAKAAGFRQVQGADLRAELQKEEEKAKRLKKVAERAEQEIKVQQELKVSFEEDVEELADRVSDELVKRNERFLEALINQAKQKDEADQRRRRASTQ